MHCCRVLCGCLLLLVSPLTSAIDEETGWSPRRFIEPAPWQEQEGELPAYPEEDRLLKVATSTGGLPFRVYIDPASLVMGDDQVARYTVVIISSSGVWNVSHEGLHCGERAYRRYAYGFDGRWQPLEDSPWLPVSGRGANQYRETFYNLFMCNPTEPYPDAEQVLGKMRSATSVFDE